MFPLKKLKKKMKGMPGKVKSTARRAKTNVMGVGKEMKGMAGGMKQFAKKAKGFGGSASGY